jgi:tRNA(Ile)-lysidine synthase
MNPRSLIKFIQSKGIFSGEDHILLAVSGGIDSTVMAHLFNQAKYRFAIAHCNFCLRGKESDEDEDFVKRLAKQLKVPFFTEKFDTSSIASQQGTSIQMAARDLRYSWFEKIRRDHGFAYVATAHHQDDQAETFLINLIRGTGIAGLHGIPVKNGAVIRPLMFAFRKDIEEYATHHQINYRTDHTNNETKYLRNKIRHELIPLLCNINPEFTRGLTASISRISAFEQVGNQVMKTWCRDAITTDGKDQFIDIQHLLKSEPVEPYAWALLSPYGFNETQVANILGCLDKETSKTIFSATHRLMKDRQRLILSLLEPKTQDKSFKIGLFAKKKRMSKPVRLDFERISDVINYKIPVSSNIASFDAGKLQFPLTLRKWQHGDAFFPFGMKKKKKVSDFFIDQKFSLKEKEQAWFLCSGNDIMWIIGHRIDHRYRVTSATREVVCVVTSDG